MGFVKLSPSAKSQALAFLERYEAFCVPLVERILSGVMEKGTVEVYALTGEGVGTGNGVLPPGNGVAGEHGGFCEKDARGAQEFVLQIRGIFSWSKGGQIFHCFPWKNKREKNELYSALCAFLRQVNEGPQRELFSINGEERGTALFESAVKEVLKEKSDHSQKYDFMKWCGAIPGDARNTPGAGSGDSPAFGEAPGAPGAAFEDLVVRRCDPSFAKALSSLQTAYEKEEVVFDLSSYDENASFLSLKKALGKQVVFALEKNGVFIAKAGTNARGIHYVQLGGIFTALRERKKGYGAFLLGHLLTFLFYEKKSVVLFVKEKNAAARRLYEKCGFSKIASYEIVYY